MSLGIPGRPLRENQQSALTSHAQRSAAKDTRNRKFTTFHPFRRLGAAVIALLCAGGPLLASLTTAVSSSGCSEEQVSEEDPFAGVDPGDPGRADSASRPTFKSRLRFEQPVIGRMTPVVSGYHTYPFTAKAGHGLRIIVESSSYKPYVRLTYRGTGGSSGKSWSASARVRTAQRNTYSAILDVMELPRDGTYEVLVSTTTNMLGFPVPVSSGEYTLTAEAEDIDCTVGDNSPCWESLQCETYPNAPANRGFCAPGRLP